MIRLRAVAGVLIVSFSAIFVRLAAVSPTTAAFFRAAYALPFLFALWYLGRRAQPRSAAMRGVAFVAGLFLGLDLWFWHRAIEYIGAGLGTVLGNTQVVFVGLLAWLVHRERPNPVALYVLPVVLIGALLISGLGRADAYGSDPRAGVIFGCLTAVSYSLFLLIFRRASRLPGGVLPFGPLLDASLGAAIGALILGAFDGTLDFAVVWPAHGWLLALAVASQVTGWLLIGASMPQLPALTTSILLLLQPTFALVWARLIFAERLSSLQFFGMVMVLGGVGWLSARGALSPPRRAPGVADTS